jgi:integrase
MSKKNSITTCDYINFDEALNTGIRLMKEKKTELIGLYIIVSIYTGLRSGDVKQLTFEQLSRDKLELKEQKTNKVKEVGVNPMIHKALAKVTRIKKEGLIFLSQKNTIISNQQLNKLLQEIAFSHLVGNYCKISTHSLRKTFGRRIYELNGKSEDALNYLSEMFNHSSLGLTRRYLGIRKEELNKLYMQL